MFIKLALIAASTSMIVGGPHLQKAAPPSPCPSCCCPSIVIRTFEGREADNARKTNWQQYCGELDQAWTKYRKAGSTPEAFKAYKVEAMAAKRKYVSNDTLLVPIFE